jgi:CheY-like chemotaxis protein
MTLTTHVGTAPEILVVDDDVDIRETLHLVLEEEGFRVALAANGEEALRHLQAGARPAVILLDLMMPVMNGWQFRAAQRADERLAAIPVIVVTAAGGDDEKLRAVDAAVLRKPIRLDVLLEAIRRLVAGG